ncbi:MAG: hypothetical protein UU87_C0002G0122 [Parcubacteria group bacterium GW2011_GWA2_42_11]|nr:MAG: hypothetical protein UU87_C0002G0122 [Parcubacteria group bacterium GW2011_GWA2_42_11]
MPKKIIISIIAVLILIAGYAVTAYQMDFFPFGEGGWGNIFKDKEVNPADLIVFNPKTPNIPAGVLEVYQQRFNDIKNILQNDMDNMAGWLALGVIQKSIGDYESARDTWLYVNKIRPKNSISFANLGDLYAYNLNNPGEAEIMMQIAIENDPTDINYILNLANIYRYKYPGKEGLFEKTLLDAEKKFSDNVDIISTLAAYYRQTKQKDQAIFYYEKLVQLDPNNQTAKQDLEELKNE